jgi:hypothetical protein
VLDFGLARAHELPPIERGQRARSLAQLLQRQMKDVVCVADHSGLAEAPAELERHPTNLVHRPLIDPDVMVSV